MNDKNSGQGSEPTKEVAGASRSEPPQPDGAARLQPDEECSAQAGGGARGGIEAASEQGEIAAQGSQPAAGGAPQRSAAAAIDPAKVCRQARLWAAFPVAILAVMFVGLGSMAVIAIDDPSFAVEKDYYQKAVDWDDSVAQREVNERLGWTVTLELTAKPGGAEMVAKVRDRDGRVVRGATVDVEAFHNARAGNVVEGRLQADEHGSYRLWLPLRRSGLWELRFVVQHGGERFTEVIRRDAPGV